MSYDLWRAKNVFQQHGSGTNRFQCLGRLTCKGKSRLLEIGTRSRQEHERKSHQQRSMDDDLEAGYRGRATVVPWRNWKVPADLSTFNDNPAWPVVLDDFVEWPGS